MAGCDAHNLGGDNDAAMNRIARAVAIAAAVVGGLFLVFVGLGVLVAIAAATAAGILAYLLDNAMKVVVDRGRPPVYLSDVLFHGYPTDPRGSGYPSSHTAVAVAVVVGAWPWLNRPWRVVGAAAAALISLNRMYVGAHFPLDILGGAAVGFVCGGIVLVVVRQLSLRSTPTTA